MIPSDPLDDVRELAHELPGVEEGPCYGTPGFRVAGKFLARMREDGKTLVIRVDFGEREALMATQPETFYLTDHYRNYPAVFVRLATVDPDELRELLEDAWRERAPKRLLAAYEKQR